VSDVIPLPNPSDGAATAATSICAGCGAPLAPDQRYCLSCGRPCSPVRLAFLDVLQGEHQPAGMGGANSFVGGVGGLSGSHAPSPEPDGLLGSLRRYSGLFGLLGVLLAALLIGLLVGHWLTGGSSAGPQVLKVDLDTPLAAAAAPASATPAADSANTSTGAGSSTKPSTNAAGSSSPTKSTHEEKAEEVKEAKEVAKPKPLPAAHKASSTLEKLAHSTGKKHAEEENKLGTAPIETGH
jgi:predicted lipid-binding transport protein (Tim44 family)